MLDLQVGVVESGIGIRRQAHLPYVIDHAHDREPVLWFGMFGLRDPLPNGVLAGPDSHSRGLAHNDDTGGSRIITLCKIAAAPHCDSHGPEVTRTYAKLVHRVVPWKQPPALELKISSGQEQAERAEVNRPRRHHTRQVGKPGQRSLVERVHLRRGAIDRIRQFHRHGEDIFGTETRVDRAQLKKTLKHQARAGKQYQGQRDFGNY